LEPLGANCAGSQFLNPDGNFPNHVPNPEDAEAMASATAAVLAADADLGVVFDTDVDRSGACVVCESLFVSESCLLATPFSQGKWETYCTITVLERLGRFQARFA